MTRVILGSIDPMPALRAAKKERVNTSFNSIAQAHIDQVYSQKKIWAATRDSRLQPEADLRGITVEELSELILSKPDLVAQRELQRQKIMMAIDSAQTPAELETLMERVKL